MLFSVLLLFPSIAGFTDSAQVKGPFVYPSQGVVRQAEMSEWVAQGVSKDMHERCLAAKDYLGCIQSNSGQSSGASGSTKDSASILGREKCFDTGVCIAQSGQDQLGLAKVVGWLYRYNGANNTVNYWNPEAKRVPHKGQPARYVAATPGYCREISPAKTTCTPTYSGGHWVAGTPGTAGGPRRYST